MFQEDTGSLLSDVADGPLRLEAYLQPILSIRGKSAIGYEALCRGVTEDGSLIAPARLFARANRQGTTIAFDRQCRMAGLTAFQAVRAQNPAALLFLNFDTSIIDEGVVGSDYLLQQVRTAGIPPDAVVIEIIESRVRDVAALHRFVSNYREYGFLLALDDVGAGNANLDRIALIKPDLLKIDRSLLSNLVAEPYLQVVVKSLAGLAKNLGALAVAEGIEDARTAVCALELGANLLQGYYFARPAPANALPSAREAVGRVAAAYQADMVRKIRELRCRHSQYGRLIAELITTLATTPPDAFEPTMRAFVARHPALECLYVLDNRGVQETETIMKTSAAARRIQSLYHPARKGTDHALKEYYYVLVNTPIDRYTTEPYISLASGQPCLTTSICFHDITDRQHILCVDVQP